VYGAQLNVSEGEEVFTEFGEAREVVMYDEKYAAKAPLEKVLEGSAPAVEVLVFRYTAAQKNTFGTIHRDTDDSVEGRGENLLIFSDVDAFDVGINGDEICGERGRVFEFGQVDEFFGDGV
jgi:hypothetical protein